MADTVRIRHTQTREERVVAAAAVPYFPDWSPVARKPKKRNAGETGHNETEKADG
ncbi:MAG TPA: hypothetical protein VIS06_07000 [Mycobacteriales bacterium]